MEIILLSSFLAISSFAIPRWGNIGACWAWLGSMALYAAHFVWRVNTIVPIPLTRGAGVAVTGGFFILLCKMLPPAYQGSIAFVPCSASFCGFLLFTRLIQLSDAVAVWQSFLHRRARWSLPLSRQQSVSSLTGAQ